MCDRTRIGVEKRNNHHTSLSLNIFFNQFHSLYEYNQERIKPLNTMKHNQIPL